MNIKTILIILAILSISIVTEGAKVGTRNLRRGKKAKSSKSHTTGCRNVKSYKSNGFYLEHIITSMVENQDFSSYCQDDFDIAEAWFINPRNHPTDGKQDDDHYMKVSNVYDLHCYYSQCFHLLIFVISKERFTLSLIYSANCKQFCKDFATERGFNWMGFNDHCQWLDITCNDKNEIINMDLNDKGLSGQFTLFQFDRLEYLDVSENIRVSNNHPGLSGVFTIAGSKNKLTPKSSLKSLHIGANSITNIVGAEYLPNLRRLYLVRNDLKGELSITENNFPESIEYLYLNHNKLTGLKFGNGLTNLKKITLYNNQFRSLANIVGLQSFTSLESLHIGGNYFEGEFVITREYFPLNITALHLGDNKLTRLVGANLLTNLSSLSLWHNKFEGEFDISAGTFPLSVKYLSLGKNLLNAISGAQLLSEKVTIDLSDNDFEGEFVINAERFPQRSYIRLRGNTKLTNVFVGDDIQLGSPLDLREIDGITVNEGLCIRNIEIVPEDICNS